MQNLKKIDAMKSMYLNMADRLIASNNIFVKEAYIKALQDNTIKISKSPILQSKDTENKEYIFEVSKIKFELAFISICIEVCQDKIIKSHVLHSIFDNIYNDEHREQLSKKLGLKED